MKAMLAVLGALLAAAPAALEAQADPRGETASLPSLSRVDQMHEREQHEEIIALLEDALDSGTLPEPSAESGPSGNGRSRSETAPPPDTAMSARVYRAELEWRLSRALCNLAGLHEAAGIAVEAAIEMLDRAVARASRAIELAPDIAQSYFWRGASRILGATLQSRVAALFAASSTREDIVAAIERDTDEPEFYYVLCQVYTQVPGFPISFGDTDAAVSFGRKAVALHEEELARNEVSKRYNGLYIELAKALWKRNWSVEQRAQAAARKRGERRSAEGPLERAATYSAVASLEDLPDRREAIEILRDVVSRLRAISTRDIRQQANLENARDTLENYERER